MDRPALPIQPTLYTHEVESLMYQAKARLPKDFPLSTDERQMFNEDGILDCIIIVVEPKHFDWRTVEQRLDIAMTLERLKQLIREEGIPCEIEKPSHEQSG